MLHDHDIQHNYICCPLDVHIPVVAVRGQNVLDPHIHNTALLPWTRATCKRMCPQGQRLSCDLVYWMISTGAWIAAC